MKRIYRREINHIVANHSIKNKSTAYCFKSKSTAFMIIRKLIQSKWIECKNVDGPFLFVRPSKKMIAALGINERKHELSIHEEQKILKTDIPVNNPQLNAIAIPVAKTR